MTGRLRQGLVASAVLLALLAIVWTRTDIGAMRAAALKSVAGQMDVSIRVGKEQLAFFPFFGVHLSDVELARQDLQITADDVFVHVGLLPLLFGKTEIQYVEFMSPHFRFQSLPSADVPLSQLAALPFSRLQIHHGLLAVGDNPPLLKDFQLDVRDIGRNRDMNWELQAMLDGHLLRSHGRLSMRDGQLHSGFGKLKLEQIPAGRLAYFLPAVLARQLTPGMSLSGSGTWDLTSMRTWSLFGDLHVADDGHELGQARGKLQRQEDGRLVWRDSFLHIGDKAVVAINGDCDAGICESRLKANGVPLGLLRPLWVKNVRQPDGWQGNLGFDATARWQGDTWQLQGVASVGRSSMRFGADRFDLPAMRLQVGKLGGEGMRWSLDSGRMLLVGQNGALDLQAALSDAGNVNARISTAGLADAWRPMGNVLLASFGQPAELRGDGLMKGELNLRQSDGFMEIDMQSDLGKLHLSYGKLFDKPAGVEAAGRLELGFGKDGLQRLVIDDGHLAGSSVRQVTWQRLLDRQVWAVSGAQFDIDGITAAGVRLPPVLTGFAGRLSADVQGELVRVTGHTALLPGSLQGSLTLQAFGSAGWRWSGLLQGGGRKIKFSRLRLDGNLGYADFSGDWSLPAAVHADVLAGELDWEKLQALPGLWSELAISGKVRQVQLKLLGNSWQQVGCSYRWQDGKLVLRDANAHLAGGDVTARELALSPADGSLALQGDLQLRNLHLQSLKGLQGFAASELKGRLYGNIKLDGALPATGLAGWRSNGDLVIYDGYRLPKGEAAAAVGTLPMWAKLYAFRILSSHFDLKNERLKLSDVQLKQMGDSYRGQAEIAADGTISGAMRDAASGQRFLLSGGWPRIIWEAEAPKR
ncbi:MAG TPA: hypothetical protein VNI58_09865 [Mariprofundaceae bacterium]|nr:hypothetical protein [Mariprofundaceae bacterium]